jgi:hypothetical protein
VATEIGGCAIDIDNEADYDAARARFDEWLEIQSKRALHSGRSPARGEGGTP